jgi:hypothetical protein
VPTFQTLDPRHWTEFVVAGSARQNALNSSQVMLLPPLSVSTAKESAAKESKAITTCLSYGRRERGWESLI